MIKVDKVKLEKHDWLNRASKTPTKNCVTIVCLRDCTTQGATTNWLQVEIRMGALFCR